MRFVEHFRQLPDIASIPHGINSLRWSHQELIFLKKKISKFVSLRDENWAIFRDLQPTPCARSSWTLRLLFQAFVLNRRRSQEVSRVDEQRTKAAFLLANYKNHQFIVCSEALISACYSVRHRRRSRFCANLENKKHSAQLRIRTRYTARPPALTIEVSFKNHDMIDCQASAPENVVWELEWKDTILIYVVLVWIMQQFNHLCSVTC